MNSLRVILLVASSALPVLGQGITITTPSPMPTAVSGRSYTVTLSATGGGPASLFWAWSGNIPPGLSLGSFDGQISGTPGAAGTYNFTVTAALGENFGSKAFVLKINQPIVINSD